MNERYPAPWSLRGNGHIFVFRFSDAFLAQDEIVPRAMRSSFVGGFGALMLVNYTESNCGPYQELLLIPGNFRVGGEIHASISRIFVSTEVSVESGRRNWGIPKELADFNVVSDGRGGERWQVRSGERAIFQAVVRPSWFSLPIPLHSALMPHTLAQCWEDRLFVTKVSASGWGRPASLHVEPGAAEALPGLAQERPWFALGLRAKPFRMTFHEAALA